MNISISPKAPGEHSYQNSVVSNQPFTVTITGASPNGTVSIYANSQSSYFAYKLGTTSVDQNGNGSLSGLIIKSVLGLTDSSRIITAQDNVNNNYVPIYAGVWFQVTMTVDCPYQTVASCGYAQPCGSGSGDCPSSQCNQPACGSESAGAAFVALPCNWLTCGKNVAIYSTSSRNTTQVPIEDWGPFNTDDPYWNGTGVPRNHQNNNAGIDGSDGTWNNLGLQSQYSCSYSNPSGNTTVQWRFT